MRYNKYAGFEQINEDMDKSKKLLRNGKALSLIAKELNINPIEKNPLVLHRKSFKSEDWEKIVDRSKTFRLDEKDAKDALNDNNFKKIVGLVGEKSPFLYNFIYFFFVEKIPYEGTIVYDILDGEQRERIEVVNDVERFVRMGGILDTYEKYVKLLKKADKKRFSEIFKQYSLVNKDFDVNFIDPTLPNAGDNRTNFEIFSDTLEHIESWILTKDVVKNLPPILKNDFLNSDENQQKRFTNLLKQMKDIPEDPILIPVPRIGQNGEVYQDNIASNIREKLWGDVFGRKLMDTRKTTIDGDQNPFYGQERWMSPLSKICTDSATPLTSLNDFIQAKLDSISDFKKTTWNKINIANKNFGKARGVRVIFDENDILIVQIYSFAANALVNGHTQHCIRMTQEHWNHYVRTTRNQYYIYNFNLDSSDNLSTIGTTIEPDHTPVDSACQDKNNLNIYPRIKTTFKQWEKKYDLDVDLWSVLKPKSKEDLELALKAERLNKEMVDLVSVTRKLTEDDIAKIKEAILDFGANINFENGKVIKKAIADDNMEFVRFCIDAGSEVNFSTTDSIFKLVNNMEIFDILISKKTIPDSKEIAISIWENFINKKENFGYPDKYLDNMKRMVSFNFRPKYISSQILVERIDYDDNGFTEPDYSLLVFLISKGLNIDREIEIMQSDNKLELIGALYKRGIINREHIIKLHDSYRYMYLNAIEKLELNSLSPTVANINKCVEENKNFYNALLYSTGTSMGILSSGDDQTNAINSIRGDVSKFKRLEEAANANNKRLKARWYIYTNTSKVPDLGIDIPLILLDFVDNKVLCRLDSFYHTDADITTYTIDVSDIKELVNMSNQQRYKSKLMADRTMYEFIKDLISV